MRPERKAVSFWFQPGRAQVVKQPLGVVGIIVPWNYPIFLAVGPLVSALAAGNRVMVKMSELAPRLGELFATLISSTFPEDHVAVVNGGVDVAQEFSATPFDHLLFTGSTAVGHHIMRAASDHLTPVTLELGGKSPAIVAPGFPVDLAARRIIWGRASTRDKPASPRTTCCCRRTKSTDLSPRRATKCGACIPTASPAPTTAPSSTTSITSG